MAVLQYFIAAAVLLVVAYGYAAGLVLMMWLGERLFEWFRKDEEDRDGFRGEDS